jgi:multicomponent Na+:H+ antiporter subunit D
MGLGGLLLGGLPVGLLHTGSQMIEEAGGELGHAATLAATALTGAAVLRAAARIFLGWSGAPGVELFAPTEREQEKADRPLWLMLLPCAALLILALLPNPLEPAELGSFVSRFLGTTGATVPAETGLTPSAFLPVAGTLLLLGLSLLHTRPTRRPMRLLSRAIGAPVEALQWLHSGLVTDYVTWTAVGLALMAIAFAI